VTSRSIHCRFALACHTQAGLETCPTDPICIRLIRCSCPMTIPQAPTGSHQIRPMEAVLQFFHQGLAFLLATLLANKTSMCTSNCPPTSLPVASYLQHLSRTAGPGTRRPHLCHSTVRFFEGHPPLLQR